MEHATVGLGVVSSRPMSRVEFTLKERKEERKIDGKREKRGEERALPRVTMPEEIGLAPGHPFTPLLLVAACDTYPKPGGTTSKGQESSPSLWLAAPLPSLLPPSRLSKAVPRKCLSPPHSEISRHLPEN